MIDIMETELDYPDNSRTDKDDAENTCFFCRFSGVDADCSEAKGTCQNFQRKTMEVAK